MTEYISRKHDGKQKYFGIFLDLSKAMDTVSVPILLSTLNNIDIQGLQYDLFKYYVSNNRICVKIGSYVSDAEYIIT